MEALGGSRVALESSTPYMIMTSGSKSYEACEPDEPSDLGRFPAPEAARAPMGIMEAQTWQSGFKIRVCSVRASSLTVGQGLGC